jgi:hypothetical protein
MYIFGSGPANVKRARAFSPNEFHAGTLLGCRAKSLELTDARA